MIKIDMHDTIQVCSFTPFDDLKDKLLKQLYLLIAHIHKEPLCINYELFIRQNGELLTVGRWSSNRGLNLHQNMQYIEEFFQKKVPIYCKDYSKKEYQAVIPPLTALSLFNEK